MNLLGLEMRKIKGTPYKLVLSNHNLIGIFQGKSYIERKNMSETQMRLADKFHADTFVQRLNSIKA
jgi:hypothetical protein